MQTIQTCNEIVTGVLTSAAEKGAQMASCLAKEIRTKEFNADATGFTLMRTLFDRSVSVTTYTDGKKGAATINSFDDDAVQSALADSLSAAESADSDDAWEIADTAGRKTFSFGSPEPDTEKLFQRTREFMDAVRERHPKIVLQQLIAVHNSIRSVYGNSHDVRYEKMSGHYTVHCSFVAREGELVTGFEFSSFSTYDLDTPFIDCGFLDKTMTETENRLHPIVMEGKFTGTAILAPDCALDLVGRAMEVFAGDRSLLDDTSIWKDALDTMVADEGLTVSFCPLDDRIVNGARYTGEGYLSEDYTMIDHGRLKSFCISRYTANKTGNERAGNDSGNMIIPAGDKPLADIIASIDQGILVGRFSGGFPDSGGELSGIAKSSLLIENGKIKGPVTEVMISCNLADMLKNLRAASTEVLEDGYCSIPYLAFDGITVSGK